MRQFVQFTGFNLKNIVIRWKTYIAYLKMLKMLRTERWALIFKSLFAVRTQ